MTAPTKESVANVSSGVCPICENTKFGPARNGRMSRRGLAPRCLSCDSLERHRAGRVLIEALRDRELFKDFRLLQFGDERIVAKGWFREVDTSIFGRPEALNPMAISKPDGAFDCIVSSHVITKVADHAVAVRELIRVMSARGFAFLSFPLPILRQTTTDWGFPDPKQSGNYRILGTDFEVELAKLAGDVHVAAIRVSDPVTNDDDLVYILSRGFVWIKRILAAKLDQRLLG